MTETPCEHGAFRSRFPFSPRRVMDIEYIHPPAKPADLTPRQLAVARLVAHGYTDKQVGGLLGMAANTVRVHVVALAYRLHLPSDRNTRVMITRWWFTAHPELPIVERLHTLTIPEIARAS